MRRTPVLVGIAIMVAFGSGAAMGWLLATRQQPPEQQAPPGLVTASAVPDDPPGQPARPPELFGTIEDVHPGVKFLVRSRQPKTPGWDSPQNEYHRRYDIPCWVLLRADTPIHRREDEPVEIAVGQTVSAWCSGGMYTTNPPGWGGDFVVIERGDR